MLFVEHIQLIYKNTDITTYNLLNIKQNTTTISVFDYFYT